MGAGPWTTIYGDSSDASGSFNAAFGSKVNVKGDNSAVVGHSAKTRQGYSAVLGAFANSDGIGTIAVGYKASASSENSIAFGSGSSTNSGGGVSKIAIGDNAYAGTSGWTGSVALGGRSSASHDSVAIGFEARTYASNSVALGRGSQAIEANTVSVGTASNKRRVVNVYQGTLASGSTDAVNGGQLYNTNQNVSRAQTAADTAVKTANSASATANTAKTTADSALAQATTSSYLMANGTTGTSASKAKATGIGALAVGVYSEAEGVAATALGRTARAKAEGAIALGDRAGVESATSKHSIAIGTMAKVGAQEDLMALGRSANASGGAGAMALGASSAASHLRSVALGSGSVTSAQDQVSVGSSSIKRKIINVADGAVTASSYEAVTGRQLHTTNQKLVDVDSIAKAAQTTASTAKANAATALTETAALRGLVSQTSASSGVRLGEKNSGTVLDVRNSANASRKITGVADAALSTTSTDAVTGRQLNATNSNVSTALSDASAAKTAANTALTQVGTLNGLLGQASASGDVRVGEKNSGTVLDVRNSANANRKLTGVADGAVSASSYDAVNGRQLNATNDKVATVEGIARSAGTEAAVAKIDAAKALAETAVLGGLVAQVSASGNVRLGEKNSGTTLDVRNSANANRKISGVADGALSSSSADAVSGRQLYSTNSRISALEDVGQFLSIGVAPISEPAEAGAGGVAIGNSAKSGSESGTAVGTRARAMGRNSTAIGRGATVFEESENGFAMGAGAEVGTASGGAIGGVAIGAGAKIGSGAHGSLALGSDAQANEAGVASFGNSGMQRRLVNIARGTADHNATTVSQLKDSLATLGGGAGMDANGNIIAPTYTVQGGTQNTVEDALTALDGAVITAGRRADKVDGQLSSIFQDSPSARTDGTSQIALNGVNGMVLTNLADGRVAPGSRDAVTGNQLYAAEQKISQNRNDLEAMRKEREMGERAMRGLDASVIDYGGARLTGVADGSVSGDSHDVVTGRQLFGVSDRVSKIEHQGRFLKINTDELSEDAFAGFLGVAIGDSAMTGVDGGTALGAYARALGDGSVALCRGSGVSADAPDGFAVGVGSRVHSAQGIAIGLGSVVESGAAGSLALGAGSAATEFEVVSFGNPNMKRRLVNIANGTANHNAATVGQLRGALSALGGEVDANGNIVSPRFNVQGQAQSTLNGALQALDGAVVTNTSRVDKVETQLRSVFQDVPSVRADGVSQLTLAGANGMVISNVANGLIAAGSRDAVNGGQLHSMQQQLNGRMDGLEQRIDDAPAPRALASSLVPKPQAEDTSVVPDGKDSQQVASVGEGDKPTPQPKANKDESPKPQVDTAELEKMLARANEYTDGAISNFERRLDKMDKRFNRMAAMSSAQKAMAMNTAGLATYNRLGAGVGYSEGESAMAVGYQRVLNEKGSATFSLNGAFTNSGERSMGVGVGIGW